MPVSPSSLSSEDFALLSRVIRTVARRHRLTPEDAEDFGQTVHLKLLERSVDVFERFEGRSSLTTYLTAVVSRLLLDWRNATRGKWRPSAAAVRLGPDAVALERLMHRDGLTRDEAVAILASRCPAPSGAPDSALSMLAERLPGRVRRTFVREAVAEEEGCVDFHDPLAEADARRTAREVRTALRRACASLPPEDRQLIAMRFGRALTVRAIGQQLKTDPKPLYRRIERSLATLRRTMASLGVRPEVGVMSAALTR